MPKIAIALLTIVLLFAFYFWQNRQVSDKTPLDSVPSTSQQNYINKEWKFSLKLPEGYFVSGDGTLLYAVRKPSADDETPTPDLRIRIEQGSKTTIDPADDSKVVSQEEVAINNVRGHKIVVSYEDYPEGSECPVYRLHSKGVVYELSLYECLESPIFEGVVQSFKII
jgi:cytoskeletal protein RodZ